MKRPVFLSMLFSLILMTTSYAQVFDTLLYLKSDTKIDRYIVYDIIVTDEGSFQMLYERNHELFYYDSRKEKNPYFLGALTKHNPGDKLSEKKGILVKNPLFYSKGKFIIAPTDLDQDGKGGRFVKWDLEKGGAEYIETDDWGIDIYGISPDGRYIINYYSANPGRKLHLTDIQTHEVYKVDLHKMLYSENFLFSEDGKFLLCQSVLRGRSFKDVVFNIPELTEENNPSSIQFINPFLIRRSYTSVKQHIEIDVLNKMLTVKDINTGTVSYFKEMEAEMLCVSPDDSIILIAGKNGKGGLILLKTDFKKLLSL